MTQISARIKAQTETRINQCDIFHDIDIVENIEESNDGVMITYIHFPLVICLNQDCDLNSDNRDKLKEGSMKDCQLLHLLVAPLFNFDIFKQGGHWGDIFQTGQLFNPKKTDCKKIMNNEDPRFHYLHFEEGFILPDLIVDFKHFYTINTATLYRNIDKRVCSLSELYREKISQRYAYFLSRIGLPDDEIGLPNDGSR